MYNIITSINSSPKVLNKNSQISFLFLGMIMGRKGIYDLLSAVKMLKDEGYTFKLIIGGVGETQKNGVSHI